MEIPVSSNPETTSVPNDMNQEDYTLIGSMSLNKVT